MIDRLASDSLSVALRHAQAGDQFAWEAARKKRSSATAAPPTPPPPPAFSLARPQWTPIPGTRVSLREFLDEYKKVARGQKTTWTGPGGWQKNQYHYIWDAPKLDATRPLYVGEVLARPDKPTAERLLPQRIRDHLRPKRTKKTGTAPTDSEQLNQLLQIAQTAGGGSVSFGGKKEILTPDDIFITPIGINKDPADPVDYDRDPNARHSIEQQLKAQLNPLIGHDLTKYPVLGFEDKEEDEDEEDYSHAR